jgi:L-lactate dehydrogenase complex protein LldE
MVVGGADAVAPGDLGCMFNIERRLHRRGDAKTRALHVAEVLTGKITGQTAE